ncbi:MAG TPA: DUF427 domain-containing protein [Gammaproteobacteria bacterium]|nr:DUF427 domain-containing protein [Gammaproteobacteria bacterium]
MRSTSHDKHDVSTAPWQGRVRIHLDDTVIADSERAVVLHETGLPDVYYLPREDVRTDLLEPTPRQTHCPYKGDAVYWTVRTPRRVAENAVWSYLEPLEKVSDIRGHMAFYADRVDRVEVRSGD